MALGGGGPLNKKPDHATFLGNNNAEAFIDYSAGGKDSAGYEPYNNGSLRPAQKTSESNYVNPTAKFEPIHGDESLGLGTSTFLEGAPASRTAMQRRGTDTNVPTTDGGGGGLQRKKSLAQKIRGISNNKRDFGPSGRVTSPDGVYDAIQTPSGAAYTPGGGRVGERNPFFNEFEPTDKKGESITIVEPRERPTRARAPSSPPTRNFSQPLERRMTGDSIGGGAPVEESKPMSGFLSRVRSMKGGRKPRETKPSF